MGKDTYPMQVCKYHGCGNDFLIMEAVCFSTIELPTIVTQICDRHMGIGADGVILVHRHPLRMEYYNSDGSCAPMCGNGIRCFARYVYEQQIVNNQEFKVLCNKQAYDITISNLHPFQVRVNMGHVSFSHELLHIDDDIWQKEIVIEGRRLRLDTLFLGTIHTVITIDDFQTNLESLGEKIHRLSWYHEKTNVNFVVIENRSTISVRTFERGAGMTLACGSGSCAAAYDAWRHGLVDRLVKVCLPRGELLVQIHEDDHIELCGPAEKIMEGVSYVPVRSMGMRQQALSYNDREKKEA